MRDGCRDSVHVRSEVVKLIADEPLAEIDYAELVDSRDLQPIGTIDQHSRLMLAVRLGDTRLIDNGLLIA